MKNLIKASLVTALIASGSFFCGQAQATPIAPGALVNPVPAGMFSGNLVCSSSNAFGNSRISGTLNSFVYANDPNNSLGGLTFVYQINANTGMPDAISQLSTGFFSGLLVDVSQLMFGGTDQAVTDVQRSGGLGDTLRWEFQLSGLGALDGGEDSFYLIAQTNATQHATGLVGILDGQSVNVLACVPGVPDGGSTVALLGAALGGIGFFRRKFRKA